MLSYPALGSAVAGYLAAIDAEASARPLGTFRGGSVISLASDHYLVALLPTVDPDEAMSNCLAYLQNLELYTWDIVHEAQVGEGDNTMTVLHLQPAPIAA